MASVFDISLRHLDAIAAIAREGGVSAAANAVNLSQPALTQALGNCEALLGHRLFDRQPGGATPTAAGRLFVIRIERALAALVEGGRRVRRSARLNPIPHLERTATMGQLRALLTVERAGSYALAAREIGLSQPSVHRAVKELELLLGVDLLLRAGRTVRPTPRALRLVRAIRLMASELQAGLDELAAQTRAGAGRVTVGALPLPRAGLLPEALASFARGHAHAEVTVVEGPYGELLQGLRGGDIDLIVGALREPVPTADVVQTALFSDALYIVARADHPLAGPAMPDITALSAFPWVVGARGAPMRAIWERFFGTTRPALRIECSSILTARGLLLSGDWLALMSDDQFRLERESGLLATVGDAVPGSRRRIGITTRADWRPTATQDALVEALTSAGERRPSGN